jgi:uncharacterized RDD family membrane protein YckC
MSAGAPGAMASLGARFAARLVDMVILAAAGALLGALLGFGPAWLVLQALVVFAYFVGLDVAVGTTPGKRVLGLALVGPAGARVTVPGAAAREVFVLAGAVPYVGPLLALVAWTTIAVTARRDPAGRGWHDRLAGGTRVEVRPGTAPASA